MQSLHSKIDVAYNPTPQAFKSRRDELVARITDGINRQRVGTKYNPITTRAVALLINKNPFLARSDDEIEWIAKECERKGKYSFFFWIVKPKNNTKCSNCGKPLQRLDEYSYFCPCTPDLHLSVG